MPCTWVEQFLISMVGYHSVCGQIIDHGTYISSQLIQLPDIIYAHSSLPPDLNGFMFTSAVSPSVFNSTPTQFFFSNEAVTFLVHFLSSFNYSTSITWQRSSIPIAPDRFKVDYSTVFQGTTSLTFTELRRSDSGKYRVLIRNSMAVIPQNKQSAVKVFDVNVVGECCSSCCKVALAVALS